MSTELAVHPRLSTAFLLKGGIVGLIAGMMMAMFTMIASASYLHLGFFAPLYSIAAPVIGSHQMTLYVMHGTFTVSGAIVGLMVHMMNSFVLGAVLALILTRVSSSPALVIGVSVAFALVVEAAFALVILPAIGSTMAKDIGLASFAFAHIIFGMTAGGGFLVASGRRKEVHS